MRLVSICPKLFVDLEQFEIRLDVELFHHPPSFTLREVSLSNAYCRYSI
jgi:hypothetical protein